MKEETSNGSTPRHTPERGEIPRDPSPTFSFFLKLLHKPDSLLLHSEVLASSNLVRLSFLFVVVLLLLLLVLSSHTQPSPVQSSPVQFFDRLLCSALQYLRETSFFISLFHPPSISLPLSSLPLNVSKSSRNQNLPLVTRKIARK